MVYDNHTEAKRGVGAALGIGILLLPIVFAWFTLRKGYSALARGMSLGWMALITVIAVAIPNSNSDNALPTGDEIVADAAPEAEGTISDGAEQQSQEPATVKLSGDSLKAKMKHHAECVIAIQYATGFIQDATRDVAPTTESLAGEQKMQNRLDAHIQGIKSALIAANDIGESFAKDLAKYGDQVQEDTKNTVLKSDQKDRELRSLELMNLGIGDDCEV